MTRANANPWFTDAGAANSIMPIVRFVTPSVFASKTRGYGLLFEVDGADEEGLSDSEIASKMRGVEGGVRGLTEDFSLYQYMRVTSGFEIPRQKKYADPITQSFVDHRLDFLAKTANFRRIDLHWCLTLEPKLASPFAARPKDQADENDRLISQLQKAATILETHLSSVIGLRVVGKEKAFKFFAELFNLEEWAGHIPLVSDQGIDQQIATSAVSWHNDHLRVGKRHVQMFSASSTPAASQPCLYNSITNLTCDSVLCTTWRPQSSSTVRKEISAQEKWIDFFKVGIFQRVMAGKNFAQLDQGAGAKAASEGVDDLGLVVKELGKKAQGKYTVTLLLSAQSAEELRENTPLVHRTFVDAQATVIEETIGNLSAFYAMFPFNQRYNVFSLWLGEDHHARLSPVFAPTIGHPKSEDLDSEYLNVFETRQGTPFFHDAYVSGVRVQLTIGPPGTGKTTVLASIREGAETNGYTVEGFAPTSRAAGQLREEGIEGTTLQSFLARGQNHPSAATTSPHLYMLDESSLASTKQMRAFLEKIKPEDRVLVIGDTAQHQGVDAGRPFQQMQDAGMRTSQLDQIVRQRKNPELLEAVQHLAKGETAKGIEMLAQQGRITQVADPNERIAAIARDYAANPERTIIVSPDNRSRQLINQAVRIELQEAGRLAAEQETFSVLAHRSDMTGADREWAARYKAGDILKYEKGSKAYGIAQNSTAVMLSADARNNTVTVQQDGGKTITYDPKRLKGVNAYREANKEFATGDRIQFTAKDRELGVNNRDLGTITKLETGKITVQMDGKTERIVQFDPATMRHFDHGYAVTSHVSQGLTEGRVIANIDTEAARSLINTRLAYVAVSRAEHDARIYTNDADGLGARLANDVSKTSAVDFRKSPAAPAPQKNTVVQVREYADPNHRIAAITLAYAEHPFNSVVIAANPVERRELNQLIRADLQASGTVAPDSRVLPVHVEKELANPKLVTQYAPGDIIQYRQGSPASQGIPSGSAAVVVTTDTKNNQLTVRTSHGDEVIYSPHLTTAMTAQSKVYREEHQEFAQGDRIRMTEPSVKQGIRKGDFGTVTAIGDKLEVLLDKGESVQLTKEQAKHIEHGYAVDSLKTGAPDRVLISPDGSFQATSEAVSLSHTGREVSIYTSDGSAKANAVAATIALPEQLKPAIALPVQQQSEAPSNAIAPEQAPVIQHRHSRGR